MPKPTIITGIKKVYVALQTADDVSNLTYATPKYYAGIQDFSIKPKQNIEPLWAENQIFDQGVAFQEVDIEITLASLTSAQRVEILGQHAAASGGVYSNLSDTPPYVAILYKATIPGGYRYGVFYKGMFSIPDEDMKGQEGKTAYAAPKISGTFIPPINLETWEYHVDTTDPNCPADIDSTWFSQVTVPTADTVAPTVTSVPADAATGVSASADVVFTFDKAIDASTITNANVFLMMADGTAIEATLSVNTLNTIVTLHPTSALAAGSYIAVVTKNVKSASGVALAANDVVNFTV